MANRVYETMTRVTFAWTVIRVWREEPHPAIGPDTEVENLLRFCHERGMDYTDMFQLVGQLPRIAAIEILDSRDGNGALFYPDWK